jgi:UDP-2-acetamido-2-deoxy-ribo-hexuluronate aminotransferase
MQFIDLAAQQKRIRGKIEANIATVLNHGKYIMGPEVKELENSLADFVGAGNAIGCASGTDALLMALMAYHVGPGDAVFTSPFTFIATAEVISLLGATPVFVDIDPQTYNIDPSQLELAVQAVKKNDPLFIRSPKTNQSSVLNPQSFVLKASLQLTYSGFRPTMKKSKRSLKGKSFLSSKMPPNPLAGN